MLFDPHDGAAGIEKAMDELCRRASAAVAEGYALLVLSDRGVDADHAPIPASSSPPACTTTSCARAPAPDAP